MQEYQLLYNLLGYAQGGPKRALIRRLYNRPVKRPLTWQLVRSDGSIAAEGAPSPMPTVYDCDVSVCDFDEVDLPGTYTLRVLFSNKTSMESHPFAIAADPYLDTGLRLTIENARMRQVADDEFRAYLDTNSQLLYNPKGYAPDAPKKALIRLRPEADYIPARWELREAESDRVVAEGTPIPLPNVYDSVGYVCDFSEVKAEGTYRLLFAHHMTTPPFPISAQCSDSDGGLICAGDCGIGGFYDCNNTMAESYSHGMFLNGLCWFSVLYDDQLDEAQKKELSWAQQTAFDYLMHLRRPDGRIENAGPGRLYMEGNFGLCDTTMPLYGMAAYLDFCRFTDPVRATRENYEKLLESLAYAEEQLKRQTRLHFRGDNRELLATLCHLYRFSGDEALLDKARAMATDYLEKEHWPLTESTVRARLPLYEGLWMLSQLEPQFFQSALWKEKYAVCEQHLEETLQKNAFRFYGYWNDRYIPEEWKSLVENPTAAPWRNDWLMNSMVLACGLDGCFLSMLGGNRQFGRLMAGVLDYICGINFGVPGHLAFPETDEDQATVSMIANLEHSMKPWKVWYFKPRNDTWASIVNGYCGLYQNMPAYTDERWETGEHFIFYDGQMAKLLGLYQHWLKDGRTLKLPGRKD